MPEKVGCEMLDLLWEFHREGVMPYPHRKSGCLIIWPTFRARFVSSKLKRLMQKHRAELTALMSNKIVQAECIAVLLRDEFNDFEEFYGHRTLLEATEIGFWASGLNPQDTWQYYGKERRYREPN